MPVFFVFLSPLFHHTCLFHHQKSTLRDFKRNSRSLLRYTHTERELVRESERDKQRALLVLALLLKI